MDIVIISNNLQGENRFFFCNASIFYTPTEAQMNLITRITPSEMQGRSCTLFFFLNILVILINQVKLFEGIRSNLFEFTIEVKCEI